MDTFKVVIVIFLSAVLLFIFPLMTMSDRTDDVAQLVVETATVDFVDNARSTGKITPDEYNTFIQTLNSTGNTYDVEIEIRVLDENPGKKTVQTERTTIGENVYYTIYTSQVLAVIAPDNNTETPRTYALKEGDFITVRVRNVSQTLSQQLKNFFYTIVGNDVYTIAAEHGGIVSATGK